MIPRGKSPWSILGVPRSASLETVRKAFTKLALLHHPDVKDNTKTAASTEQFISIRQAYETIKRGDYKDNDSMTMRGSKQKYAQHHHQHENRDFSERAFLQYFFDQTGLRFTPAQRREMVFLHRTRIPNGRYDGPSWEIARRLAAEQEVFLQGRPNDMHDWWNGTVADEIHGASTDSNRTVSRRKRRR